MNPDIPVPTEKGWEIVSLGPTYADLARYNGEVAHGLVHTEEWRTKMADLQERFNEQRRTELIADGYQDMGNGAWMRTELTPTHHWWAWWRR